MRAPIVSFWTGSALPDFDRLCLASWRALGYPVRLYAYEEIGALPEGVALCDAETILPRRMIFDDAPDLQPCTRANLFRMALLRAGAGVWLDTDILLLRPLPERPDILVSRERGGHLCNAVLWARRDLGMMREVLDAFARRSVARWGHAKIRWRAARRMALGRGLAPTDYPKHQWGRHALRHFVRRYGVEDQVLPQEAFHHPLVYTDAPFRAAAAAALRAEPGIVGLHCFAKGRALFRDRDRGSVVDELAARLAAQS